MSEPLILLDAKKIKSKLDDESISIEILEQVDSTNHYIKNLVKDNHQIQVVCAEMQTNAKGRLGRAWFSPPFKNIYFSIGYKFKGDVTELSGLSLVVGLATALAIEKNSPLPSPIQIKWPNDLIIQDKKMAGILIEIQTEPHRGWDIIIGIGINVNMTNASQKEINQDWSSLYLISKQYIDRNVLCASLINYLKQYLQYFMENGLGYFMTEWEQRDYLKGRTVQLNSHQHFFSGIAQGINQQGNLLLSMADNSLQAFSSGDTTLLK